jgi:hypothetical protein
MGTYFLAIIFIAIAALSLWYGGAAAWSDADALRSRWLVNQWRDGTGPVYSLHLWQQTHDELQTALRVTPGNAQLLDDLGFLNAARAMGAGTPVVGTADYDLQQKLFADAIGNYRTATVLRPTFPYTWAYLALAKQLKGEADGELWSAFDKALRYGRNEAGAQPAIAQVAFAHWAGLSPERKAGIIAMINHAQPTPRKKLMDLAQQSGVVLPL